MKIVAISDTHNKQNKLTLPKGDVVCHAGDATSRGSIDEIEDFLDWYASLDFKHKIFVPGNHDWGFETKPEKTRKMCEERGIILLIDEGIEIDGVKFWGSPVQPWFYSWAFNRARGDKQQVMYDRGRVKTYEPIKPHWDMIPEGTNVLITHGPPYKILDELVYADGTPKGEYVGCHDLYEAILRVKPDVHIFGHIHCGYGEKHQDGTSFYNASICDEMYYPSNSPHVIEI